MANVLISVLLEDIDESKMNQGKGVGEAYIAEEIRVSVGR